MGEGRSPAHARDVHIPAREGSDVACALPREAPACAICEQAFGIAQPAAASRDVDPAMNQRFIRLARIMLR
jgi:hypothetical protein